MTKGKARTRPKRGPSALTPPRARSDGDTLEGIHHRYHVFPVTEYATTLSEVVRAAGIDYKLGRGYYQLGRKKQLISAQKRMVLWNGDVCIDDTKAIRSRLRLGALDVCVGSDVCRDGVLFIQSTSENRYVRKGSSVLYMANRQAPGVSSSTRSRSPYGLLGSPPGPKTPKIDTNTSISKMSRRQIQAELLQHGLSVPGNLASWRKDKWIETLRRIRATVSKTVSKTDVSSPLQPQKPQSPVLRSSRRSPTTTVSPPSTASPSGPRPGGSVCSVCKLPMRGRDHSVCEQVWLQQDLNAKDQAAHGKSVAEEIATQGQVASEPALRVDLTGEKISEPIAKQNVLKLRSPPLVVTKSPLSDPVSDVSEESPGNATSHGIIAGSGDRKSPAGPQDNESEMRPSDKTQSAAATTVADASAVPHLRDPAADSGGDRKIQAGPRRGIQNTYGDLDDQMPTDPSSKPKKTTVKLPTHAEFERFSFSALADFLKKLGVNSAVVAAIKEEEYDGATLLDLNHSDLLALTQGKKGRLRSLERALAPFRHAKGSSSTGSATNEKWVFLESDIKIGALLGQGNFANTYRAVIRRTGVAVAIKVPKAKVSSHEAQREMASLLSIGKQRNILKFIGIAKARNGRGALTECFLTELCELGSLDRLHKKFDLCCAEKLFPIARGLFLGMMHLHCHNIIHRDIACRNVLVRADWSVVLSDYGLARQANDGKYYKVMNLNAMAWPWMSPEALREAKFCDKSDVWAAGVTIWEILTRGGVPYNCNAALRWRVVDGTEQLRIPANTDASMSRVVAACLTHDYRRRPSALRILMALPKGVTAIRTHGSKLMKTQLQNALSRSDGKRKRHLPAPPTRIVAPSPPKGQIRKKPQQQSFDLDRIPRRHFEMEKKFWEIGLNGTRAVVKFGRIGSSGITQVKAFPNAAEAQAHAAEIIASKLKKGYREKGVAVGDGRYGVRIDASGDPADEMYRAAEPVPEDEVGTYHGDLRHYSKGKDAPFCSLDSDGRCVMQHVDVKLTRYKMMMIRGQDRSIHAGSAIGEIKHMLGIYARSAVKSHLNVPAKAEFKGPGCVAAYVRRAARYVHAQLAKAVS